MDKKDSIKLEKINDPDRDVHSFSNHPGQIINVKDGMKTANRIDYSEHCISKRDALGKEAHFRGKRISGLNKKNENYKN